MRAIVFEAPRRIRWVEDAPRPRPAEGEVLVRCTHIGICGSNMGPYLADGDWAAAQRPSPPGWTGHENLGVIVESRCSGWEEGTQVVGTPTSGGFAEYITATPDTLARLPAQVSDPGAFLIAQPIATVLRVLARTAPVIGQRCAVIGQGPIGLIFTHLLSHLCAGQIIAIERVAWRLEWARRLGATDVIDSSCQDVRQVLRTLTPDGRVDLCVDAAGTPDSLLTAAYLPRPQGRLLPFGVPHQDLVLFPWVHANHSGLEIVLSNGMGGACFLNAAVDLLVRRVLDLLPLVAPRLSWEQAAEAFEMYADPAAHPGSLKVVLEM